MFGNGGMVAGTARLEGLDLEVGWSNDQRRQAELGIIDPLNILCNH